MFPSIIGEKPSPTAAMQPTSSVDTKRTPAVIMIAALVDTTCENSAAYSMRSMEPTQPSPSSGKRKRFSVGVKAVDEDVHPDWARERKHAKHRHSFDSNDTYDKLKMVSRQPSPPSGKRKRFSVGVRVPDDDVEPDHAKQPKHAKHNHGMVMDIDISFGARPAPTEMAMEVEDSTFMDWVILDSRSASEESASSSIDVEMTDYVMIDTPSTDVEMSDNDVIFHDFDANDEIELTDVVMDNSLIYEPELESPSEDVMTFRNNSFGDLYNTIRNAPMAAAIISKFNSIVSSHSLRDDMILGAPVPAARFNPFHFLMSSNPFSSSNAMNEPTKTGKPKATVAAIGVEFPATIDSVSKSTATNVPELAALRSQPYPSQPEAPRKEQKVIRPSTVSVHALNNTIPCYPMPVGTVSPSKPIVFPNSISSSNATNVPTNIDKPKTTIICPGMDVPTITGTLSTSTNTSIPDVAIPENQPSPVQPAAPRKGNGRARRNAINGQDLDGITPDTPTPAVRCNLPKATASSSSTTSFNAINVPLGTDKPKLKTAITSTNVGAPTTTSASSTSTTKKIPEANKPENQQAPAKQEPPHEGCSRVRRSDARLEDLVGEYMSTKRYKQQRRSR
ncbi:hypothetical protein BJ166DRAFT_577390 [Pestalotiopsis sp. NC0098]|nr:hypothetical protein BJ166DRAFT_577390 [Pestalotiopsis sp. NC0098]